MSHGAVPKQPVVLLSLAEELAGGQQDAAHARAPAQPGGKLPHPSGWFLHQVCWSSPCSDPLGGRDSLRFYGRKAQGLLCCLRVRCRLALALKSWTGEQHSLLQVPVVQTPCTTHAKRAFKTGWFPLLLLHPATFTLPLELKVKGFAPGSSAFGGRATSKKRSHFNSHKSKWAAGCTQPFFTPSHCEALPSPTASL